MVPSLCVCDAGWRTAGAAHAGRYHRVRGSWCCAPSACVHLGLLPDRGADLVVRPLMPTLYWAAALKMSQIFTQRRVKEPRAEWLDYRDFIKTGAFSKAV